MSSDMVTVSVEAGVITLTALFDGTDMAWTYARGYPFS